MATFLENYVQKATSAIWEYPEVLSYLYSRKLDDNDIRSYRLGYSTLLTPQDDGTTDFQEMKKKTYNWLALKGKLIFPVTSCNGSVIGLIVRRFDEPGKIVDEKIPRYRQFVTQESNTVGAFFGMPQASSEIMKEGFAYVVEGPVDCISLSKAFRNTVSTLTSAINGQQMWTLSMMANQVVVVFDSDAPGKKGAAQAEIDYGKEKVKIRELGYKDANACLSELGASGFRDYAKRRLMFKSFSRG